MKFLSFKLKALFIVAVFMVPMLVSARGVTLTPLRYSYNAERGDVVNDQITVRNTSSDIELEIIMEKEHMEPTGEAGHVVFREIDEEDEATAEVLSAPNWITFEEDEFLLEPGESRDLSFTIEVPENATPGGHYAGIIAGTPAGGVEGTGVGISHRVAATMMIDIYGDAVEELEIADFTTDSGYYEYGPVTFESRFQNTGTVHLRPDASIEVTNFLGDTVAELDVEESAVLPSATRLIETEWGEERLWGGKYKATLTGVYGENGQSLGEMTTTFYAFPWKYGLAGLLVVVFFILTRKRWITILKILVKGEAALKEGE